MKAIGVMDFAGGFACGVSQAGFDYVAKREPSDFAGFGVAAVEANFEGVQIEVSEPELWSMQRADYLFGCPPCSGFSALSTINKADSKTGVMNADGVRVAQRGVDSPVNQYMFKLVDYAARVKPRVMVMESVGQGGKMGAPLMRELWQRIREATGLDYHMTDVFMNAALVGGDVIRKRYFLVLHLAPFGVDLPRGVPRPMRDVIGDLPRDASMRLDSGYDPAWGHVTNGSSSDERSRRTIELFNANNFDWAQGSRLPEHLEMWVNELGHEYPDFWYGTNGQLLSHAVSDNMYAPFRWRWETPMGVVTGGFMDRAVHPVAPRPFTYREGARFMGLPDDWSLEPIVSMKRDNWLGKAIPVSSGRWISTWAKASIEEEPGEYAGVEVEPGHRVIDVDNEKKVAAVEKGQDEPVWWDRPIEPKVIYSYETVEPSEQRRLREEPDPDAPKVEPVERRTTTRTEPEIDPTRKTRRGRPRLPRPDHRNVSGAPRVVSARIAPEVFLAFVEAAGLDRKGAAAAMGVSPSRITELTTHSRPKSWLNAGRWDDVQAQILEYAQEAATVSRT